MKFAERFIKWCPEPLRDYRIFGSRELETLARKTRNALIQSVGWTRNVALFVILFVAFLVYPQHAGSHSPLWYPLNCGMWGIVLYFSYLSLRWVYHKSRDALDKSGWCPIPPRPGHGFRRVLTLGQMKAIKFPSPTGIMMAVSIILCLLISMMGLTAFSTRPARYDLVYGLLAWSFSLIAVGFSLAGAFLALKKKETSLLTASTILMMASGALSLLIYNGWIVGTPTLMITTLSLAYHKFSNNGMGGKSRGDSSD